MVELRVGGWGRDIFCGVTPLAKKCHMPREKAGPISSEIKTHQHWPIWLRDLEEVEPREARWWLW